MHGTKKGTIMRSRKKWRCGFTKDVKRIITEDTGKNDPRMVCQTVFDVANPQTSKVVQDWFGVMFYTLFGHGSDEVAVKMNWEFQGQPDRTRVNFYKSL